MSSMGCVMTSVVQYSQFTHHWDAGSRSRTNYIWLWVTRRRTKAHREKWRRYDRCHQCSGSEAVERLARDPRPQSRGRERESSIHGHRPRRALCATCPPGPHGFSPSPASITTL